jgi:hypothetical protein
MRDLSQPTNQSIDAYNKAPIIPASLSHPNPQIINETRKTQQNHITATGLLRYDICARVAQDCKKIAWSLTNKQYSSS